MGTFAHPGAVAGQIAKAPTFRARLRALRAHESRIARKRRRLAEGLELAVDRAGAPRPRGDLSAAVPIATEAAADACGALLDLAERLRQPRSVNSEGLALVRRLLTDGGGPLYYGAPGELRKAALLALQALETGATAT